MDSTPHRFRLERIRTLRERSEDQAKQALAGSLERERAAEQGVADAVARIVAARDALAGTATAMSDAASMRARQAYIERTEAAHRASVSMLAGRSREVDDSRSRLVEAARDRQSMDRLRDRSLAAHRSEAGRRERSELDEIALNGYRRKAAA